MAIASHVAALVGAEKVFETHGEHFRSLVVVASVDTYEPGTQIVVLIQPAADTK